MDETWLIFQLSPLGEVVEIEEITLAFQELDKKIELYVPAFSWTERGITEKIVFLPGYIFVRNDLSQEMTEKVLKSQYICQILKDGSGNAMVSQKDFDLLKERFRQKKVLQFKEGDEVVIAKGFWKGYNGKIVVIDNQEEKVVVLVKRESMERLIDVPIFFVEENQ